MQTLQVVLSSGEIIGLTFTFILVIIAIVTLILKINANHNEKLKEKVDIDIFKAHEKTVQDELFTIKVEQKTMSDHYMKVIVSLARIEEGIKSIKENCKNSTNIC